MALAGGMFDSPGVPTWTRWSQTANPRRLRNRCNLQNATAGKFCIRDAGSFTRLPPLAMNGLTLDTRVLTVTFSEFGRRVSQNASGGTDHGTAAPMFICGPMIRPGVIGDHPSLTDLDQGDLKYKIDFRSVYAGVLEQWLQADSKKVLGSAFRPVSVLRL